jgi:hypothetical protein
MMADVVYCKLMDEAVAVLRTLLEVEIPLCHAKHSILRENTESQIATIEDNLAHGMIRSLTY